MTETDWMKNNLKNTDVLLREEPKTQEEKDIWNLKYMLYGIGKDSHYYRLGCVSTLRRIIKKLEDGNENR
jgi:hypothetical protein